MKTENFKKGVALCLLSTLVIAGQDTMSKTLVQHLSLGQIVMVRHIFFVAFALWWIMRDGNGIDGLRRAFVSVNRNMQILRSVLMTTEILVFFAGLQYIGVAQAHAVFSLFPILATLMAALLLREKLNAKSMAALALGFVGALLVIRPGGDVFEPGALIILAAAFLFALYNVITRFSTHRDGFKTSMAYMAFIGLIISTPWGLYDWRPIPNELILTLLITLCFSGTAAHLLIVKSLEYASASALQPYNYAIVGWAALFGWLFYGELLDSLHTLGIVIIVTGGLIMTATTKSLRK
ncbi:MAG: DMT family transporter [Candidatus Zeuxoniibacter abyssi]|nr:MAG: DMT family transporter [Candidatus Persebacteraceae bacterium AB1(2)]